AQRRPPLSLLFPYTTLFRSLVLVQANYTVSTSLPTFTIPQSKNSLLIRKLQALVDAGKLNPYDDAAVKRAAVNIILANPDAYYVDRKSTRLNSSHEWISYAV